MFVQLYLKHAGNIFSSCFFPHVLWSLFSVLIAWHSITSFVSAVIILFQNMSTVLFLVGEHVLQVIGVCLVCVVILKHSLINTVLAACLFCSVLLSLEHECCVAAEKVASCVFTMLKLTCCCWWCNVVAGKAQQLIQGLTATGDEGQQLSAVIETCQVCLVSYLHIQVLVSVLYLIFVRRCKQHVIISPCHWYSFSLTNWQFVIFYILAFVLCCWCISTLWVKKRPTVFFVITMPNVDWFSKFNHLLIQQEICNRIVVIYPTTP